MNTDNSIPSIRIPSIKVPTATICFLLFLFLVAWMTGADSNASEPLSIDLPAAKNESIAIVPLVPEAR